MRYDPPLKIDTRTGYLDHLARHGLDVRRRVLRRMGRIFIDGNTADDAGSLALQELANEFGQPVVIEGASEHHVGLTYSPTVRSVEQHG